MEHLPPWLRNVPLPPPPDEFDETPAWLRGIDRLAPPPAPAEASPDWLTALEPAAEAAEVPDWLAELQAEVSDPLAGAEPAAWLADATPEPPTERPSTFGATGWLQSLSSEPTPAAEPPVEPPPTTSSRIRMPVGPTDWLRSIGHEEAVEPAAAEPSPEPPPVDPDAGVPEWLRDLSDEEITQAFASAPPDPSLLPSEPAALQSEPALDAWLNELAEIAPPANSPDWIANVAANDETVVATNVSEWLAPDRSSGSNVQEPDLPAWLQNVAGDEPPAAPGSVRLDLPSWLLDEDFIASPTTTTPPIAPDAPTLLA
ncbi:MAG: hypothetical protein RMK72_11600, partial [Chloroflexus sp.]|nr:hypothetical protein [Chloroflexus sp.]